MDEQLAWAASILDGGCDRLRSFTDQLGDLARLDGWGGTASDAARVEMAALLSQLHHSIDDAEAIGTALALAADEFGRVQDAEEILVATLALIDQGTMSGADRDLANRALLESERTRLEAVAAELRNKLHDNLFGGLLDNADAGLEQTEKRIVALDAIESVLDKGNRQLLVLDNSGEKEAMAAIAVGDVDTASNIAVFVPGLGSTVEGDILAYDEDVAGIVGLGDAGITWLGYEAPQLGWDLLDADSSVLDRRGADVGGEQLSSFLDDLPSDRHVTAVGHSYGSVVVAAALTDDVGVDDVVMLGSPGVGVSSASELNAEHVYVIESPTDVVADTAWFGRDTSLLPGAELLASDGADGHSEYFDEGTASAVNLAAVVSGAPTVAATPSVDAADVVRVLLGIVF